MDLATDLPLIDKLRNQISQKNLPSKSPIANLKSPKFFPNIHKRSTTEAQIKPEVISRDLSHRFDSLSKIKSTTKFQETKLKEILGIKPQEKSLPKDMKSLESYISKKERKLGKKKVFRELEMMKVKISKQKEKLLNKLIDEGGLLYKTQSGIILPQLTNMYESLLKRIKDGKQDLPRTDLDLGNPSGRKEVEIIIGWLENMISTFVHQEKDISLEERVRRASMIYTVCFREVVRQVSSHCIERGILLQKIWNAQIDIYCSKEDDTIKKIDEIKEVFEDIMKDYEEKYKNKAKNLEKSLKEFRELVIAKDAEVSSLKSKIDEMKINNERDRRNLIMNFTRPTEKKKKTLVIDEEAESDLVLSKNDLIKAKIPAVLYGYFDLNGLFFKKNVVQMANGKKLENNSEEVIKFSEVNNRSTGCDDFFEYLLDHEISIDFSSQFPDRTQLSICKEGDFTYRTPFAAGNKKRKREFGSLLNRPFEKLRSTSVVIHGLKPGKPLIESLPKTARNFRNSSFLSLKSTPEPEEELKNLKIIESKVMTPKLFKTNKIFKKILNEKIDELSKQNLLSGSVRSDSKENSIGLGKLSPESSVDSKGSNAEIPGAQKTRSRINSTLNPDLNKKKLKKASRKSMVVSPKSNNSIEIKILNADTGNNINPIPMKYTIIKTPPLSSSSSSEYEGLNDILEEDLVFTKAVSMDYNIKKNKTKASENLNKNDRKKSQKKEEKKQKNLKKNSKFEEGKTEKIDLKKSKKTEEPKPEQIEFTKKGKLDEHKTEKNESNEKLKKIEELIAEEKDLKNKSKIGKTKNLELRQKKSKKNAPFTPRPESFMSPSSKSQSVSVIHSKNPSSVKGSIEKRMSEIDNDPLLKSIIFSKLKSVKSSLDLQDIIKDLFPDDLGQVKSPGHKDASVQTDELDNLITLSVPKTPLYESRTPGRSRRKSFTKFEGNFQLGSQSNNSLGFSAAMYSEKSRSLKKHTLPMEEFALGVINRKIVITHPGEKFFNQVLPLIKSDENKLPRISLKTLLKMMNLVYQEKMTMFKENACYFKYSANMVLYDALMKKYGLKNVAEEHFVHTVKAALFYKDKYLKIMQFYKFLGCEDDEVSVEEWNLYLRAVDIVESYGKWVLNEDINDNFCALSIAFQVIHSLFDGKLTDDAVEDVLKKIVNIKIEENQSISKRSSAQKIVENVNIDSFIQICIDTYISVKGKIKEKFWPSLNKEDVMNEEEFLDNCKGFKFSEPEPFPKLFEKYAIVQKLEEDKVQKVIKIRSFCALVFEYLLYDIKDLQKRFKN